MSEHRPDQPGGAAGEDQVSGSGLVAYGDVHLSGWAVAGRDVNINLPSGVESEVAFAELLKSFPVSVRAPVRRIRDENPMLASLLVRTLGSTDIASVDLVRQLVASPPAWLSDQVPYEAWIAVGEFASAHGAYETAAMVFGRLAELGAPWRARWLARAALAAGDGGRPDEVAAHLARAEALGAADDPFVGAARSRLAKDPAGVLAAAGSPTDFSAVEPLELALLVADAHAALGNIDIAIQGLESILRRNPELSGAALGSCRLLLLRVQNNSSTTRFADLRRARQLAIQARDARRVWRGPSEEAVACTCQAAGLASDWNDILTVGLPAPAGAATAAEASSPDVLQHTAQAAIALGDLSLANELIGQISDPAEQAFLLAQVAQLQPDTRSDARAAYHRALALTSDDGQRMSILWELAKLGEWPLPGLEEIRIQNEDVAEIITAISEAERGYREQAVRRLRSRQGSSPAAAAVLAEVHRRAGNVNQAVETLQAAYRRFGDTHALATAAVMLANEGHLEKAEEQARRALAQCPPDSPDRGLLRQMLMESASQRGDWSTLEEHARAVLEEDSTDPSARWALVGALAFQGRVDDSWAAYRQVPSLDPGNEHQAVLWFMLHSRFATDVASVDKALEILERYQGSEEVIGRAVMALHIMARELALPEPTRARLQQATARFFERHPANDVIQQMSFESPEQLLTIVEQQVKQGAEQKAEIARMVSSGRAPLGMLAVAARKPYTEVLILHMGAFLPACFADQHTFDVEERDAGAALDGVVIIEPSALCLLSFVPERWKDVLAAFEQVVLPDPSRQDIVAGRDMLALRSTMSFTWDQADERMQIVEVSPEQADGWAQHSAWIAQAAAVLESATCRAFPTFTEIADEWTQGWLAPLEVAKQRSTALYSDDAVLRALARSVGIAAFGTAALVAALVADGRFSAADQDATILELRRARVVDLPFDEDQLLTIADADQWVPGPVYLAMSRPALWQHGTRALDFYRMGSRRIAAINADYLPEWLFVGVLGFGRLPQANGPTGAAEILLSTTALEVGLDPTIFARLVQAARRASVQIGGNDPLPKSANHIIDVFVQALGPAGGARFVLHVFSGLEPVDRLIAVREVLKTDRKQR